MTERRYSEREVAAIFEHAARHEPTRHERPPGASALTLREVQRIAKEVGISSERVAQAAVALDESSLAQLGPPKTFLGLPLRLTASVDLPHRPTEEDWEGLRADLHEIFGAPGNAQRDGTLRIWNNDHLQVSLEATVAGGRLRVVTRNPQPWAVVSGSIVALGMGLLLALALTIKGKLGLNWASLLPAVPVSLGLVGLGAAAWLFPRWQSAQQRQLRAITERALERARLRQHAPSLPPSPPAPEATAQDQAPADG